MGASDVPAFGAGERDGGTLDGALGVDDDVTGDPLDLDDPDAAFGGLAVVERRPQGLDLVTGTLLETEADGPELA